MSVMEDLISFDLIETQKENIQSLPQGRSAKALAAQFGPSPFSPMPTPGATRTLNDAMRQEYEIELQSIADADDPLDIYDRYVKWTMNAYPSAQATPESQLRPLLERATKTFQGSVQYKNDVRYLKMWLTYIRFFSDAPRETYAYLSRHGIGDGLALFYEEFAAWLEGAGRWTQAEEVYKLGIEKEARPAERLMRKFGEFQRRFDARPQDVNEPTSPALPTVRPALAAKLDPFATSTPTDPQSRSRGFSSSATASKSGRAKMSIFSDADGLSSRPTSGEDKSKGWDNIGTVAERRKENVMEARPWAGETLKAGKKAAGPKMMVFKDQSMNTSNASRPPVIISTRNGKTERWFVDILSVYPNEGNATDEYCFEELRAKHRGWLDRTWSPPAKTRTGASERESKDKIETDETLDIVTESTQRLSLGDDTTSADVNLCMGEKKSRPRKKKLMEVRGETQTVKAVLDSPTSKPKLKRKKSAEPTMTLHTRAATDDVLDIFNQPLRNVGPIGVSAESDGDTTEYDPDDYTCGMSSAGDNTRTGNLSETGSEYNDDDASYQTNSVPESTQPESVSPWSDFNTNKHIPAVDNPQVRTADLTWTSSGPETSSPGQDVQNEEDVVTPTEEPTPEGPHTGFIAEPPQDFKTPTLPYRSAEEVKQTRLPFMTPIVEMTESSMGLPTLRPDKAYKDSRTPSRGTNDVGKDITDLLSDSPLQKVVNETRPAPVESVKLDRASKSAALSTTTTLAKEALIKDFQCNPHDEPIRDAILHAAVLKTLETYHDARDVDFKKGPEIRRYIKSLQKSGKPAVDRTTVIPPSIRFPGEPDMIYNIKRELGKGAYAPVYLASAAPAGSSAESSSLIAVKSEAPPSPWEFYILSTLHNRLALSSCRTLASVTKPHAFHHFADEVYLLESYHDQGTLLDLVNLVRSEPSLTSSASSSAAPPGLDECVAMFFAVELLRSLSAMHAVGVLHGDLKADNCLVRLEPVPDGAWSARYSAEGEDGWEHKGLVLIDFGRGIDMSAFRRDVGFLADWKTSKDDCVEMRELRPWTHQVDYWGAAGVLHVLLFGKWIEDVVDGRSSERGAGQQQDAGDVVQGASNERTMVVGRAGVKKRKLKEPLKRYWQTELWAAVFDVLMNPVSWVSGEPDGMLPVSGRLAEARAGLEMWLVENSEKRGLKVQLRRLEERIREKRRRD